MTRFNFMQLVKVLPNMILLFVNKQSLIHMPKLISVEIIGKESGLTMDTTKFVSPKQNDLILITSVEESFIFGSVVTQRL